MPTESNTNMKEIARQFFLAQDRQKGPLDATIVAPSYTAFIGSNPPMNMEGHSGFGIAFYQGFPDIYHTIDDVIAEGNQTAVRFTLRGTHTGNFMGIPATGRSIHVSAIAIMHITNDMVTQLRAQFDQMGMMRQLGVIPG